MVVVKIGTRASHILCGAGVKKSEELWYQSFRQLHQASCARRMVSVHLACA